MREQIVIDKVPWRVSQSTAGSWKAYTKIAGQRFELHRVTRPKILDAVRDKMRELVGYDPSNRWGSLEAWQEWRAACVILERCGVSAIEAARFYEENHRMLKPSPLTDAVADYCKGREAENKENKWDGLVKSSLENLCAFAARRDVDNTARLDAAVITAWLAQWKGKTRNDKLGMARTFLKWCRARGMVRDEELLTSSIARSRTVSGEVSVMSPAMLRELWRQRLTVSARRYLAVAAWTGARRAEILRLAWPDVRFGESVIVLAAHKTKTATRRLVPLTAGLKKILAAVPVKQRTGALVPADGADALTAAGNALLKDRGGWPRNALRHSWISYRVAETGDVARVAIEAGTSREKIFSNYRAVETLDGLPVTKPLAAEWFALPGQITVK